MPKIRYNLLFVVFAIVFLFPLEGYSRNKVKTIVIFFAWNASLPAYQNILEGFRDTFYKANDETYNLQIEYLDINRFQNRDYAENIVDLYNEKYNGTYIDLLILIGPWTYPVLKTYGFKALAYAQTISVENDNLMGISTNNPLCENLLELKLKYNFHNTLKTAFDLFPENKNIYIISGSSVLDVYYTAFVRNQIKDFKETRNFIFISGTSMDSTLRIVEKIPPNSSVIITTYTSDSKNIPFSTPEVIGIIASCCRAPVFPILDTFTRRKGGIGGYVFSYTNVGKEIGEAAKQILHGRSPRDIKISEKGFYQDIFDWQQLKKWHLLHSKAIRSNSIIYNKDINFFAEYKWYLVGLLIFIFSQTFLIVYLIKLNRRQKEFTRQRLETEVLHRELIREDRMSKMSELTASLSHELNQPLTAILYSAQAGKRFLQSGILDQQQTEEIFDNIIDDDKRAGGIISSVKSLMKLETRDKENVDLNALVQETIDIIHSDIISQSVKIKLKLHNGPVYVFGDKIQLQQVLMNFFRNATQAMANNNPENKILEIILQVSKGLAMVSVCDSGAGIDEAIKEKLFKPFFTTGKNGFGIGLALSRSIIEKHNGEIWADNLPSGGAQFSFSLKILNNE
jgi:signal transduction histidine kinase